MKIDSISKALQERAVSGRPVRVGLVGAGKFGSMFLAQVRLTPGLQLVGVADLDPDRASLSLERTGWSGAQLVSAVGTSKIIDAAAGDRVAITDEAAALIASDLDVLVECTGNVLAATRHALAGIEAGAHVVMVSVEADVLVGLALRRRAEAAGVVYTQAYGDQPALICELVDWAQTCGFEVVAAGKGTRHRPEFHYSTPESVFEHYGEEAESLKRDKVNPQMFNSFLDGTKSAIEMAAVANATGLVPQTCGLQFPPVGIDALPETLKPIGAGGVLERAGTVEVVSCLEPDGRPVPNDLRWGVYVVVSSEQKYVQECFRQYGIPSDSTGRYAATWRPNHWIGLELGPSIARAALVGEPTGTPAGVVGEVVARSKSDWPAGHVLDGEGGFSAYGWLVPAEVSRAEGLVPLGLLEGARLKRELARDALVSWDDVDLAADPLLIELREEMEKEQGG